MTNRKRLKLLKELRVPEDEKKSRFSKLEDFSEWSDNVAPLLKYDKDHYGIFVEAINKAKMPLSGQSISYFINIATSEVNQAIIELENNIESYWSPKAINTIWHESFWGKLLLIVLTIVLTFIFSEYVFPFLKGESQQPKVEQAITNHPPKTVKIVPKKDK